ncbi:TAXI family TRAP transporter solute-binding subunit [Pseudanabaenaceae cyanobacterium LEGE 13415]|nr:TAXI family TRAP transporter solute-binding subunit [Pseudanabaenaceae cyanobacterium LEGE 13415]
MPKLRLSLFKFAFSCVMGVALFSSGCSRSPKSITLSSGTPQGYYSRLAGQLSSAVSRTGDLKVENRASQGSIENLKRLLDRQVDFALVQLDVVSDAMRDGKVQAVAILANEPIHIIATRDAKIRSLTDLNRKRVGVGAPGSGIRFTSDYLSKAFNLKFQEDSSNFRETFRKLSTRQLDATIYVGTTGASELLRQQLIANPTLQFVPIEPELINYLTNRDPGAYQSVTIPQGIYNPRPTIPDRDISTLATATVLVTRPDVRDETVGLVTWSILYNSRRFSLFYPELQIGEARSLLQKNLLYIHPGAQDVYAQNADPRNAWLRYIESNNDLQAGIVILLSTSTIGLVIQRWKRDRCKKLLAATVTRINELKQLLPHNAQQALLGIDDLSQEHRLMFIEGSITSDVYEQVQHKTQTFAEQCRNILEQQRKQFILDTLLILDDWQASLQVDPQAALEKLTYLKQQYREMLIADQVEIQAYIELMELTLLSVMTLAGTAPKLRSTVEPDESSIAS